MMPPSKSSAPIAGIDMMPSGQDFPAGSDQNHASASGVLDYCAACLEYCSENDIGGLVVALNEKLSGAEIGTLLSDSRMVGLITGNEIDDVRDIERAKLGRYVPGEYTWRLPDVDARAIGVIGPRSSITFCMAREALWKRVSWFVYAEPTAWQRERVISFICWKFVEKGSYFCTRAVTSSGSTLARPIRKIVGLPSVGRFTRRFQRLGRLARKTSLGGYIYRTNGFFLRGLGVRRTYDAFKQVTEAAVRPLLPPAAFAPGRVLLINSSLAWGGAERQITSTLVGIKKRGYRDISLLCEHLHDRPDHDFYLWMLKNANIDVEVLDKSFIAGLKHEDRFIVEKLALALQAVPKPLRDKIIQFALAMAAKRPAVVHAWQDSTSIIAGFAAALVGVPRIVLASRNLAPYHFAYYQSYMAPGYRVLSELDNVMLVNNSNAGARDYAQWLRVRQDRFRVVFNGIDSNVIARPDEGAVAAYRERHGVPENAAVIGSIFRFYREKDPQLWVETMAQVARAKSDVLFLLIGTGPMAEDIRRLARSLSIGEKLIMPGTETDPALPLSLMNVFVLTSRQEGTPNVAIEAQMLGVPVVATDAGGTCDTFIDGVTGWLIQKRKPREIAERVLYALDDTQWYQHASTTAIDYASRKFGLDRMIDETLEIYGL